MPNFQDYVIVLLTQLLKPQRFRYLTEPSDLWNLMLVCKNIKRIISEQLFTFALVSYHSVENWPSEKYNKLRRIIVNDEVKTPLTVIGLPIFLTELNLGSVCESDLCNPDLLRSIGTMTNLRTLVLPKNFNRQMTTFEPKLSNVTSLVFGKLFNTSLKPNDLPISLQILQFGSKYNKQINSDVLPPNLLVLILGDSFNQPILQEIFPESLISLTFGETFDQVIELGILPQGLVYLSLGNSFDQPIKSGTLPESLKILIFGYEFDQPIEEKTLPVTLTELQFGYEFNSTN